MNIKLKFLCAAFFSIIQSKAADDILTINNAPTEIVGRILFFSDNHNTFSLVCKNWQFISDTFRNPTFGSSINNFCLPVEILDRLIARYTSAECHIQHYQA